jgi:hypothetical protein
MKKLLMGSVVAALLTGAPVVYADDAHHPEQGGAPAAKPATPDKSMGNAGAAALPMRRWPRRKSA